MMPDHEPETMADREPEMTADGEPETVAAGARPVARVTKRTAAAKAAGSKAAGSKAAGSKAAGSKAAGSKAAGSKAAGSRAAGSRAAGSGAAKSKAARGAPAASKAGGGRAAAAAKTAPSEEEALNGTGVQAVAAPPTSPPSPAEGTGRPGARTGLSDSGRWWRLAAIAGAVIAVVLFVAVAYTAIRVYHDDQLSSARSSALSAARTYAVQLATYDYHHLAADFGVVEQHSTAAFKQSFVQSSQALSTVLTQYHATATATVKAAGLTAASTSRAVAVVFVDQNVTNSRQKGPTTDASRVQIVLVRHGGGWLIDHVNLL
jgi:Mce-associated membrane protein